MQTLRLNCALSRNFGRGDDVAGLGAIMRDILKAIPHKERTAKRSEKRYNKEVKKQFKEQNE